MDGPAPAAVSAWAPIRAWPGARRSPGVLLRRAHNLGLRLRRSGLRAAAGIGMQGAGRPRRSAVTGKARGFTVTTGSSRTNNAEPSVSEAIGVGRLRGTDDFARQLSVNTPALNPGNTAPAVLVFDVPNGTQPNQYVLLLHDSVDSHGVRLSIPPPPPPRTFAPTADDDQRFLVKLASDNGRYLPYGVTPIWIANPALAINVAYDACRSMVQKRHMTKDDVGDLFNQLAQPSRSRSKIPTQTTWWTSTSPTR